MQYPVPQFTEVEDKIFGSLTLIQFGIIFGAGMVLFTVFSVTKSLIVTIFFFLIIGLPALAIAFAKINGRPMYKMFKFIVRFFTSPKELIFHKESSHGYDVNFKPVEITEAVVQPKVSAETSHTRLMEVNRLLQENRHEEEELLKKHPKT